MSESPRHAPPGETEPLFGFHPAGEPRLLWKVRMGETYGGARPHVAGDRVFAWDRDGRLLTLDAATGTVQERRAVLDGMTSHSPRLEGDTLYLSAKKHGERGEYLCAYDVRRDTILWSRQTRLSWGNPIPGDDLVWCRTSDDTVCALKKVDGFLRWTHRLRRGLRSSDLVVGAGAVYVGDVGKAGFDSNGYVLALDGGTGDVLWVYPTPGDIHHAPAVAGGLVYVGDGNGEHRHVHCLSARPGSRLGKRMWRYKLEGIAMAGVAVGETVYWGCYEGYLHALEGQTGRPRWRFQAGGPMAYGGPPCVHDGWVFVGSRDGYLYGLEVQTGALRWKYFVVDAEALRAEAEEKARRRAEPSPGTEDWNEQERREWEAYDASKKVALSEASRMAGLNDEAETPHEEPEMPSGLDLLPWEAGGKLFLLTSQGFLHCFALARTPPEREVSP